MKELLLNALREASESGRMENGLTVDRAEVLVEEIVFLVKQMLAAAVKEGLELARYNLGRPVDVSAVVKRVFGEGGKS